MDGSWRIGSLADYGSSQAGMAGHLRAVSERIPRVHSSSVRWLHLSGADVAAHEDISHLHGGSASANILSGIIGCMTDLC